MSGYRYKAEGAYSFVVVKSVSWLWLYASKHGIKIHGIADKPNEYLKNGNKNWIRSIAYLLVLYQCQTPGFDNVYKLPKMPTLEEAKWGFLQLPIRLSLFLNLKIRWKISLI